MGEIRYFTRTQRPTVARTRDAWQVGRATEDGSRLAHQDARTRPAGWAGLWQAATKSDTGIEHRMPDVLRADVLMRAARHQEAEPLRDATWFGHQDAHSLRLGRRDSFQRATRARDETLFRHQDGDRSRRAARAAHWQNAGPLALGRWTDHQRATPLRPGWVGLHQNARRPPPGISLVVVPQPPKPPACYGPSPHLLFADLAVAHGNLLFVCERNDTGPPDKEPAVVPVRRIYFVINQVSLHRLNPDGSDGAEVPVFSLSLSLDVSSWTWGFEAVLPACAEALVLPDGSGPVELLAAVNGTDFRVLAENISRERIFGDASKRRPPPLLRRPRRKPPPMRSAPPMP